MITEPQTAHVRLFLVDATTGQHFGVATDEQRIEYLARAHANNCEIEVYGRKCYLKYPTKWCTQDKRAITYWLQPWDPCIVELICHHIVALTRIACEARA